MYSSRRRYYRNNFRRNLFSPSYRPGKLPSYTQMKGRVIRSTPLYDNPNIIPPVVSKKLLDEMYKKLVDSNYPIPMPPIPPIPDFSSYTTMSIIKIPYSNFAIGENNLDASSLQEIVSENITLVPPPSGNKWAYSITSIGLGRSYNTSSDTSRFRVSWVSPLLLEQYSPSVFIDKSVDMVYSSSGNFRYDISVLSGPESNQATFNRTTFDNNGPTTTLITVGTNDSNIQNNVIYPLVTTDTSLETQSSMIVINKENSNFENAYSFFFYVICYLVTD